MRIERDEAGRNLVFDTIWGGILFSVLFVAFCFSAIILFFVLIG